MGDISNAPTQAQVDKYDYLSGMLDSALQEMREFAKKKPDGIVSATKIKLLNRLLAEIKTVVEREPSNGYLDMLSEEELPQNSDAVLILGQFRAALRSFHERNYRYANHNKRWITQEWLAEQAEQNAEAEDDEEWTEDDDGESDEDDDDTQDDDDD